MKKEQKSYFIYGDHACTSVIKNKSRDIYGIYLTEERYSKLENDIRRKFSGIIQIVSSQHLGKIVQDGDRHQGIAMKVGPLLNKLSLVEMVNSIKEKRFGCFVMLDRVQDPQNIGAIIRSASCFGVDGILIPEHGAPAIGSTIIRSSAGFSEEMPIYTCVNLTQTIDFFKKSDFWIVGLDGSASAKDTTREIVEKYQRIVFVLGNEGGGIRGAIKSHCDKLLKIPMLPNKDSLNVSNASAIVCYEYFMAKQSGQ